MLSRLKGIETIILTQAHHTQLFGSEMLSRLKGIETF